MINTFDRRRYLPATEALRAMERCEMPRQYQRRVVSPSPPKDDESKASFDMTDLLGATQPIEDMMAFPKIEWALDDDEYGHQDVPRQQERPPNTEGHLQSSQHSQSLPSLGKRSRRAYQSRLVRSKSLKSSLCSLVDRSVARRRCVATPKEGSWGHFVSNSDEEQEMQRKDMKLPSSRSDQLDLLISPFMVFCDAQEHNGLE